MPGSLVGCFLLELVSELQSWIFVRLEGACLSHGGWGQDEGALRKAKHNRCCLANYYVVLLRVALGCLAGHGLEAKAL